MGAGRPKTSGPTTSYGVPENPDDPYSFNFDFSNVKVPAKKPEQPVRKPKTAEEKKSVRFGSITESSEEDAPAQSDFAKARDIFSKFTSGGPILSSDSELTESYSDVETGKPQLNLKNWSEAREAMADLMSEESSSMRDMPSMPINLAAKFGAAVPAIDAAEQSASGELAPVAEKSSMENSGAKEQSTPPPSQFGIPTA
jgi:hypothetical protein